VRPVTITAGVTTTLAEVGLWAGDIDGDADIDQRDWYILAAAVYPVNDPYFDLNGDGIVNIQDTTIVSGNIGRADSAINPSSSLLAFSPSPFLSFSPAASSLPRAIPLTRDCVTLRAAQLSGNVQSIGARFTLPAGITATALTPADSLTGGYFRAHQQGTALYLIAAPPEGAPLTRDSDLAHLCFNRIPQTLTLEAANFVGGQGTAIIMQPALYLPLVQR